MNNVLTLKFKIFAIFVLSRIYFLTVRSNDELLKKHVFFDRLYKLEKAFKENLTKSLQFNQMSKMRNL